MKRFRVSWLGLSISVSEFPIGVVEMGFAGFRGSHVGVAVQIWDLALAMEIISEDCVRFFLCLHFIVQDLFYGFRIRLGFTVPHFQ